MRLECENWTISSYRVSVFTKLLQRSGSVNGFYPDLIISIFQQVLEDADAELKLKMFISLSKQLQNVDGTLNSQNDFTNNLALKIVDQLILPSLKWQAGRKSEAVRIAAVSSLYCVFSSASLDPKWIWQDPTSMASKLIPSMNRLSEDDSVKIRLFICQSFRFLFEQSRTMIPMEYLVKICSFLIKRLDDVSDEVRLACLQALEAVTLCLPALPVADSLGGGRDDEAERRENQLSHHLNSVYTALLLHMDDTNEAIRDAALGNCSFPVFFRRPFRKNIPFLMSFLCEIFTWHQVD